MADSYIHVDVPMEMSKKVGEIVETNMKAFSDGNENAAVPDDLFDEIIKEAEDRLERELFKPFFKSRFFIDYKKTTSLVDISTQV